MTEPITHQDIADRLDRGDERFRQIDAKLECLPQMQADMSAMRGILEALKGLEMLGNGVMKIAKGIATIGTAVVVVWGLFKLAVYSVMKDG